MVMVIMVIVMVVVMASRLKMRKIKVCYFYLSLWRSTGYDGYEYQIVFRLMEL